MKRFIIAIIAAGALCTPANAQSKAKVAREVAEVLFERFGARVAKSVPELAARLETLAARHGEEALVAAKRGGLSAIGLMEAEGSKAVRVLAAYGEQGASRVLSKPSAMALFRQHGDEAAAVLVRHPGVAEPLLEKGGAQAVKALGAIEAQSGRKLAMLMEGELANAAHHPALLEVGGKYGERSVQFLWKNKATLAGGATLAAFLSDPEPFLNGTRDIAAVAGDAVVKPVVSGVATILTYALVTIGALIVAGAVAVHKYGMPSAETMKTVLAVFRK